MYRYTMCSATLTKCGNKNGLCDPSEWKQDIAQINFKADFCFNILIILSQVMSAVDTQKLMNNVSFARRIMKCSKSRKKKRFIFIGCYVFYRNISFILYCSFADQNFFFKLFLKHNSLHTVLLCFLR